MNKAEMPDAPVWDGGIVLRKPNWYCSFCQKDTGEMVYEWIPTGALGGVGAHESCFHPESIVSRVLGAKD